MGREARSPIGSADEAQTPPASVPQSSSRLPADPDVEVKRHAALHDPLTGLANRSLILDHLDLALARAGRRCTLSAVIFFDLDGFQRINATLGHVAGDELLMRVAQRLRQVIRPADTLGRWGGDEFVVVCEDMDRLSDASALAARISAAFRLPFDVADTELHVGISIGFAVSAGTDQPATLIHAADSAMYQAKRNGPNRIRNGHEPPAFPHVARAHKQQRPTRRRLERLSPIEVDDLAAIDRPTAATGR